MSAPETTAVLARLRTTPLPVGDARKPDGAGWQAAPGQSAFKSYLVLYPLDAQRLGPDAPLGDRRAAPRWGFQVTAVGRDRISAETAGDIASRALLGAPLDLGSTATAVQLVHIVGLGTTVDESVNPPLFTAIDRYRLDCDT